MKGFLSQASLRHNRGWVMAMDWEDLLFMHWPLDASALRPLLPPALELDTFAGRAWLGIVPFRMAGVRPRWLPAFPGLSAFPELNVRTYATWRGEAGVWFFSLDAGSPLTVRGARRFFHLPYHDAEMRVAREREEIVYASRRTHAGSPPAELRMRYAPVGPAFPAHEGTLEHWLTARYCLFSADPEGNLYRCAVNHRPWRLQPARAAIEYNSMAAPLGLDLVSGAPSGGAPGTERPLLHFAEKTEVVAWLPERLPA